MVNSTGEVGDPAGCAPIELEALEGEDEATTVEVAFGISSGFKLDALPLLPRILDFPLSAGDGVIEDSEDEGVIVGSEGQDDTSFLSDFS